MKTSNVQRSTFNVQLRVAGLVLLLLLVLAPVLDCMALPTVAKTSVAAKNTLYVDTTETGAGRRGTTLAFPSLVAAIAAASADDVIICASGQTHTLTATLNVNKRVRIIGNGAILTRSTTEADTVRVQVTAAGAELRDLEISGGRSSSTSGVFTPVVQVTAANVRLERLKVRDSVGVGISVYGGATDCKVIDSEITNCFIGLFSEDNSGVAQPARLLIDGLRVKDNWSDATFSAGIKLKMTGGGTDRSATIRHAHITNAGEMGIEAQGNYDGLVIETPIIHECGTGISIDTVQNTTITAPLITSTGPVYGAIEVGTATNVTITNPNLRGIASGGTPSNGIIFVTNGAAHGKANVVGGSVGGFTNAIKNQGHADVHLWSMTLTGTAAATVIVAAGATDFTVRGCTIYAASSFDVLEYYSTAGTAISGLDFSGNHIYGAPTEKLVALATSGGGSTIASPNVSYNYSDATSLPAGFISAGSVTTPRYVGNYPQSTTGTTGFPPDNSPTLGIPAFSGVNQFAVGTGDGATTATHNFKLSGWWGMALHDAVNDVVRGVYNFRTGAWDVADGYYVGGSKMIGAGTIAPVAIGGGTTIQKVLSRTITHDFASLPPETDATVSAALAGTAVGDPCFAGLGVGGFATGFFEVTCAVDVADTVTLQMRNHSGVVTDDPPSATYRVVVMKF